MREYSARDARAESAGHKGSRKDDNGLGKTKRT
jgi:hypothetical protein